MRFAPRSLFGRLVIVLLGGLAIAQLVSYAIHTRQQGEVLLRASGAQAAQRIADILRLLESADAQGRRQIARVLSQPPLVVSLQRPPLPVSAGEASNAPVFRAMLRRFLGDEWPIEAVAIEAPGAPPALPQGAGPMAGGPLAGGPGAAGPMRGWMGGPMAGMHAAGMMHGPSFVAQVRLRDGTLVTFDTRLPEQSAGWPLRLLASLAILLAAVVAVSLLAVRWATRPLKLLADAADELGRDIHRPPLDEGGPLEVQRAARAFNTMQSRLAAYLRERTSVLAAMSHDLKTPVTRLRLRAELLPDEAMRRKFTQDLEEMETMVAATLDYLRGAQGAEPVQAVDMGALLASVQADVEETGGRVRVSGSPLQPYPARPVALKRCLRNLVENAVKYGGEAEVEVQDGPASLGIAVRDRGPGLAPADLERVFEPFYRVDASRNRDTGGTGLGLTIARSIAELHGGTLTLHNRAEGGLEARLVLPRRS